MGPTTCVYRHQRTGVRPTSLVRRVILSLYGRVDVRSYEVAVLSRLRWWNGILFRVVRWLVGWLVGWLVALPDCSFQVPISCTDVFFSIV